MSEERWRCGEWYSIHADRWAPPGIILAVSGLWPVPHTHGTDNSGLSDRLNIRGETLPCILGLHQAVGGGGLTFRNAGREVGGMERGENEEERKGKEIERFKNGRRG